MNNKVYDDEKTEAVSPERLKGLEENFAAPSAERSGSDIAAETPAASELDAQLAAPDATESGSQKPAEKPQPSDQVGEKGYTGPEEPEEKSGRKRGRWLTRKRGIISGGIIGTVFGIYGVIGVVSGPLEFIHFAESVHLPHFSRTENMTDSRLGKLFIYSRTGSAGDTRLSWWQRKYKNKLMTDLKSVGIEAITDTQTRGIGLDYLKDWQIDLKSGAFKGMTPDDVKAWAKSNGIKPENVKVLGNWETSGKVYISARSFGNQIKSTYALSKTMGQSKIPAVARARLLGKFFDITFHPMKLLDRKLNAKALDLYKKWKTARETRLKSGASAIEVQSTQNSTDENGKPSSTSETGVATEKGVKSAVNDFLKSPGGKVAGGALLAAGFVCTARAVADGIDEFRYSQAIVPLTRIGMDTTSFASQMENGTDADTTQMGYQHEQFVTRDANGKIVSSWSDAKSIRANNGQTGGIEVSDTVKEAVKPGVPSGLAWTQATAISGLCSNVGLTVQLAAGIASFAFGGEIITNAAKVVLQGALVTKGVDFAAKSLSGEAVELGTGAELGGQVDYGVKFAGNTMAMQFAGNELSKQELAELNQQSAEYEKEWFQGQDIASRLFDATNSHSFIAKIIDSNALDMRNNFAILKEQGIMAPLRGMGSLISSLLAGKQAFATTAYDYGFATFGVSEEDQNNPLVAIPQENAKAVGEILDQEKASGTETYISRARKCYGVELAKDSQGWGVLPQTADAVAAVKTAYSQDGMPAECSTPSAQDPNWLRVRFFIIDTSVMEGWACVAGDEQSCANDGFVTDSASNTGTGSITPGSGAALGPDGFTTGNCVDFVKYILSRHLPGYKNGAYGNGKDFATNMGKAMGYTVNHTPAVHAVVSFPAWRPYTSQQYGHVAIVLAVNSDGSIVVEESNWNTPNHYGTHKVPANLVSGLTFAHVEGDIK